MKGLTSSLPKPLWRYTGEKTGYEHHHYPSERARRLFYYVRCIGEARPPVGFRHGHRNEKGFLIHFIIQGKFWHRLKGRNRVACANDCCLLDLTEPVEFGNDGPQSVHLFWAHVDGALMPHVHRELNADMEPIFRGLNRKRMQTLFRELIRLTTRQPADYEPRASTLLSSLLAELFASRTETLSLPDAGIDPSCLSEPIRKSLAMIARYYMQPKSVKGLAAEIGLSRYYFSRLFHRETGFTPGRYLNLYRLEAASSLLRTTDKPIGQIARSVGIPNVENFSKTFRKHHALSPRAYREKMSKS